MLIFDFWISYTFWASFFQFSNVVSRQSPSNQHQNRESWSKISKFFKRRVLVHKSFKTIIFSTGSNYSASWPLFVTLNGNLLNTVEIAQNPNYERKRLFEYSWEIFQVTLNARISLWMTIRTIQIHCFDNLRHVWDLFATLWLKIIFRLEFVKCCLKKSKNAVLVHLCLYCTLILETQGFRCLRLKHMAIWFS